MNSKKLELYKQKSRNLAANGSHDFLMERLHDQAGDEVRLMLEAHGIDSYKLPDDQQEDLTLAYKDGFWDPSNKPDTARLVIHLAGGLVQGVLSNLPTTFVVVDTDTDGALETVRVPKALVPMIASKRMHPVTDHQADVAANAVDAAFNLIPKS